jgi:3-deoxy-manno-octulosonate cytidylyltransferase (CMP-KDO synthetase)
MPALIAVIPARYQSTRFPGKPLALVAGKPLVQQVYLRCLESQAFSQVVVATDDQRIAAAVRGFGGEVVLTSPNCVSGTDRVAEVARQLSPQSVYVNVQGDEPAVHPESLVTLARTFDDPAVEMATLVRPLDESERSNPGVVKALVGLDGFALYFSRADLPYLRNPSACPPRYAHLGLYGYRRATLERLASLPPSPLEQAESLEQLRALENGIRLACRLTTRRSVGVDCPEDLPQATALLRQYGLG